MNERGPGLATEASIRRGGGAGYTPHRANVDYML